MRTVELYFDFVSPYSHLALAGAEAFAADNDVTWVAKPVVYAKLLEGTGLVGPVEVEAKRRYTFADVLRCAHLAGRSLQGPPRHPFRSLEALRAVFLADEPARLPLAAALSAATWAEGRDLEDLAVVASVLEASGVDATDLAGRLAENGVKEALRRSTEEALTAGVFGVPSFRVDGELFWGHDRLPVLAAYLRGALPGFAGRLDRSMPARGVSRRGAPSGGT